VAKNEESLQELCQADPRWT